jgi:hypothetical protein
MKISLEGKVIICWCLTPKCKQDNMSCTYVILGLFLKKKFWEFFFLILKKISILFLIFILLCQGLCKLFQNICNFQKNWNLFINPFNAKNQVL